MLLVCLHTKLHPLIPLTVRSQACMLAAAVCKWTMRLSLMGRLKMWPSSAMTKAPLATAADVRKAYLTWPTPAHTNVLATSVDKMYQVSLARDAKS